MHKRNEPSSRSQARAFVDEPEPGRLRSRQRLRKILDEEGDVMDPLAARGKKPHDGAVTERFKELQVKIARIEERDTHSVAGEFVLLANVQPQEAAQRPDSVVDAPDGDSNVIDRHRPSRICAAAVYGSSSPR